MFFIETFIHCLKNETLLLLLFLNRKTPALLTSYDFFIFFSKLNQ